MGKSSLRHGSQPTEQGTRKSRTTATYMRAVGNCGPTCARQQINKVVLTNCKGLSRVGAKRVYFFLIRGPILNP
jgi:hypothetical protein